MDIGGTFSIRNLESARKFFYYGCGGNDNKFYSLHMCRKVCAERLSPQIACDQCDLRTSFCKSHSKFNYTCECRSGYEKNQYGECIDIDECRGYKAVCDKNAWCVNEIGSYRCECMASYRGDGKHCTYVGLGRSSIDCKDCSIHSTCNNGVCQCKEGYEGDGFNCTDVNECLRRPEMCDKNAECINREGSFICTCLAGYAGNGYNCTVSKIMRTGDLISTSTIKLECEHELFQKNLFLSKTHSIPGVSSFGMTVVVDVLVTSSLNMILVLRCAKKQMFSQEQVCPFYRSSESSSRCRLV
ncbi:hypothetical protein CAEBREN_31585 [Caenorhabditis brenneri]|uniref:EGF-like domain-containing protein n=1 Tax=Caenorhabditis brenneri TaxID=135651 RepID=G0PIG0_CAEBE|nr:hypothetical protein CAEBREN_31585 [Caenorhabditis brenneri]